MNKFFIDFQNFTFWIIPIIILIITILYLSYINSKTKKAGKILLIVRMLIFFVLLLLFLEPSIKWTNKIKIPASVVVWIDNSGSIKDQDGFDFDTIQSSLIEFKKILSQRNIKTEFNTFSSDVNQISDINKLGFSGTSTNIAKVFKTSDKANGNIKAGILITDGIYNVGENPKSMKIPTDFPIFTIGIGDSVNKADPRVVKINSPESIKLGDTLSIIADVIPVGLGKNINVVLRNDEQILFKKTIQTSKNNFINRLNFNIVPDKSGPQKYYVEIDKKDDTNPYNNTRMNIVRVLPTAKNVLIFNGLLSFDTRMLTKMLNDQTEYNITNYSLNNDKWIPEISPKDFNKNWDLVIFMNFPKSNLSSNRIFELKQKLKQTKVPVLVFLDGKTDIEKLHNILSIKIIKNSVVNKKTELVLVQPNNTNKIHPVIRDIKYDLEDWEELPPLMFPFKTIQVDKDFSTLINTAELKNRPVVLMLDKPEKSIGLCIGVDFWRWKFMPEKNRMYDELFGGMIKWLSDTLNTSNMQMILDKEIYLTGENARISGLVYDVKGNILPMANVQATIIDSSGNEIVFDLSWDGKEYSSEFTFDKSGEYIINIKSEYNGSIIDNVNLSATVMNQSLEQSLISQNSELLKYISAITGGEKIKFDELKKIAENINNNKAIDEIKIELKLWRWIGMFYIIVILFILEWIIRRFQGYQ